MMGAGAEGRAERRGRGGRRAERRRVLTDHSGTCAGGSADRLGMSAFRAPTWVRPFWWWWLCWRWWWWWASRDCRRSCRRRRAAVGVGGGGGGGSLVRHCAPFFFPTARSTSGMRTDPAVESAWRGAGRGGKPTDGNGNECPQSRHVASRVPAGISK